MKTSVIYFYEDEKNKDDDTVAGYNHFYVCGYCNEKHKHQSINYEKSNYFEGVEREVKCDNQKKTIFALSDTDTQLKLREERDQKIEKNTLF